MEEWDQVEAGTSDGRIEEMGCLQPTPRTFFPVKKISFFFNLSGSTNTLGPERKTDQS